jgi:hypothetical protein
MSVRYDVSFGTDGKTGSSFYDISRDHGSKPAQQQRQELDNRHFHLFLDEPPKAKISRSSKP